MSPSALDAIVVSVADDAANSGGGSDARIVGDGASVAEDADSTPLDGGSTADGALATPDGGGGAGYTEICN